MYGMCQNFKSGDSLYMGSILDKCNINDTWSFFTLLLCIEMTEELYTYSFVL